MQQVMKWEPRKRFLFSVSMVHFSAIFFGIKHCVLKGLLIQLRLVNVAVNGGKAFLEFARNIINDIRNGVKVCLMFW